MSAPVARCGSEVPESFDEMLDYLGVQARDEALFTPSYSSVTIVVYPGASAVPGLKPYVLGRGTRTYVDRIKTALHVAAKIRRALVEGHTVTIERHPHGWFGSHPLREAADPRLALQRLQLFELSTDRDTCEVKVDEAIFGTLGARVCPEAAYSEGEWVALSEERNGQPSIIYLEVHRWTPTTLIVPPSFGLGPGDSGLGVFNAEGRHIGIVIGEAGEGAPSAGWAVVQLNVNFDQRIARVYSRRKFFRRGRGKAMTARDREDYERMKEQVVAELGVEAWNKADYFSVSYTGGRLFLEALSDFDGRVGVAAIDAGDAAHFLGGFMHVQDLLDEAAESNSERGARSDDSDGSGDDRSVVPDDDFVIESAADDSADLYAWQTKSGGLADQLASADAEYRARQGVSQRWSGSPPWPGLGSFGASELPPLPEEDDLESLLGGMSVTDDAAIASLPVVVPKKSKGEVAAPTLAAVTLTVRDFLSGKFPFGPKLTEQEEGLLAECQLILADMEPTFRHYDGMRATMATTLSKADFDAANLFMDSFNNAKSSQKRLWRKQEESGPDPQYSAWAAYDKHRQAVLKKLRERKELSKYLAPQTISSAARTEKQLALPAVYTRLAGKMASQFNENVSRLDYASSQAKKQATSDGVVTTSAHLARMQELKARLASSAAQVTRSDSTTSATEKQ